VSTEPFTESHTANKTVIFHYSDSNPRTTDTHSLPITNSRTCASMPLPRLFSSTIPPLPTRPLSPFSRTKQQTLRDQRQRLSESTNTIHIRSAKPKDQPPPRSRDQHTPITHHIPFHLTLKSDTTTSPTLPLNPPAPATLSPPSNSTFSKPLICHTCGATEARQLFNSQGCRGASVCPTCFSRFAVQETKARLDGRLTSFPRLLELVEEQDVGGSWHQGVTEATARTSLGRVMSGLSGNEKGRGRSDSMFSECVGLHREWE
jgi:hypothetical protein